LGRAQARLRRYEQARRAFESGAELAPGDVEFQRLIDALPAKAGTAAPAKRPP
jgi:hypothetical protein